MKLSAHEKRTLNKPLRVSATQFAGEEQGPTIKEIAASFGVHHGSVHQYRRRHPESKAWPVEAVCKQIIANRDQRAVVQRQGFTLSPEGRKQFASMGGAQ